MAYRRKQRFPGRPLVRTERMERTVRLDTVNKVDRLLGKRTGPGCHFCATSLDRNERRWTNSLQRAVRQIVDRRRQISSRSAFYAGGNRVESCRARRLTVCNHPQLVHAATACTDTNTRASGPTPANVDRRPRSLPARSLHRSGSTSHRRAPETVQPCRHSGWPAPAQGRSPLAGRSVRH
jgi:hypothetical protein